MTDLVLVHVAQERVQARELPEAIKRAVDFCLEVALKVKTKVVWFIKGMYEHVESITILGLSSIGLTTVLGELPFLFSLPMWVEAAMVIPVISVLTIVMLLWSMSKRRARRARKMVVA